ncbi:MAG: hypothetical protein H7A53_10795 [Akkermansiaceae bacterium]|nr:hypothetical protein [Akkermansiaceae bacterium]MCP5551365.1 hypothetical protein [Akkermansiaceae bacterium]
MTENSEFGEGAAIVCVRCGTVNETTETRCAECGVPLDDFAATAPWESGNTCSPSGNPRMKPVIFWGALLFFGPSAFGGLWVASSVVMKWFGLIETSIAFELPPPISIIWLAYGMMSLWILWVVSARHFAGQRSSSDSHRD